MKHILLKNAFTYKKAKIKVEPKGYIFDHVLGAWVSKATKCLLINDSNFSAIGTKKEDIETGEDQKGE